jgi:cytosine/adenosine deaminase-related metal-dependent hydrolase
MTETWWCEHAWRGDDSVAHGVLLTVTDGRITAIDTGTAPPPDSNRPRGLVIPGLANAHSHAFHPCCAHAPNATAARSEPGAI